MNRSASRLALTYGELNPLAPLNGQLLLTVSSAPSANLWQVKPFSDLERSTPRLALTYGKLNPSAPLNGQLLLTVSSAPGTNLWWVQPFNAFKRFSEKTFQIKRKLGVFSSAKNRIRILFWTVSFFWCTPVSPPEVLPSDKFRLPRFVPSSFVPPVWTCFAPWLIFQLSQVY